MSNKVKAAQTSFRSPLTQQSSNKVCHEKGDNPVKKPVNEHEQPLTTTHRAGKSKVTKFYCSHRNFH